MESDHFVFCQVMLGQDVGYALKIEIHLSTKSPTKSTYNMPPIPPTKIRSSVSDIFKHISVPTDDSRRLIVEKNVVIK